MKKYILALAAATAASTGLSAKEWQSSGFDNPGVEGVSSNNGSDLPFNSVYKTTVCQLLYTPPMLQGMVNSAKGEVGAEITGFDIMLVFDGTQNTPFFDFDLNYAVKMSNVDATGFVKNPTTNRYEWFTDADDCATATGVLEYNEDNYPYIYWWGSDCLPIHIELETPFIYTGSTILLTFEARTFSDAEVDVISGCAGFAHGSSEMVSGSFRSDQLSVADIYRQEPQNNRNKLQPAIKFFYTPVKSEKPVTVAAIENPVAGVRATAAGDANVLTFDFDIADESDCKEYDVMLGTTCLGTVTDRHVSVQYLQNFTTDQVISIVPKADGVLGTSVTIAANSFETFFKPAANETVLAHAYAEYQAWDQHSKTVAAAAKVRYIVDEGAAPVKLMIVASSNGNNMAVQVGAPEWCPEMKTGSSDMTDFEANNGCRSFYQDNLWQTVAYRFGALQGMSASSLAVNCGIRYPLASLSVPVLTSEDVEGAKVENIEFINKSFSPRIDPNAEGVLIQHIEYRNCIEVLEEGNGYFTFIAPKGHTIYFRFQPETAARRAEAEEAEEGNELEGFNAADGNIYIHDTNEAGKGTLVVKAVNVEGAVAHEESYQVTDEGIASVASIGGGEAAPVEYFNLQGVRVAEPAAGVYIRRQGNTVTKTVIR